MTNYVTFNNHPLGRLFCLAPSVTRVVIFVFRAFSTKKERLPVVYNKTVVHVPLVVQQNPLPPSLMAV